MSGQANYPTGLDDDSSLLDVVDGVSTLLATHHNNIKEAVKAIEARIGINDTTSPTSLDYRIGSPTDSHSHNGASGQGVQLNASMLGIPSGGIPSGLTLSEHTLDYNIHLASQISGTGIATMVGQRIVHVPTQVPQYLHHVQHQGSLPAAAANALTPFSFGKTVQLVNVRGNLRRGPSGATTALDVNIGPTSAWVASQGFRPIFPAGATNYGNASPNHVTVPSGVIVTVDVDAIGSSAPGEDLSIVFVFRE